MKPEKNPEYKLMRPDSGPVSDKTPSSERPERSGALKRLLDWIARGAKKSNFSGRSCPT